LLHWRTEGTSCDAEETVISATRDNVYTPPWQSSWGGGRPSGTGCGPATTPGCEGERRNAKETEETPVLMLPDIAGLVDGMIFQVFVKTWTAKIWESEKLFVELVKMLEVKVYDKFSKDSNDVSTEVEECFDKAKIVDATDVVKVLDDNIEDDVVEEVNEICEDIVDEAEEIDEEVEDDVTVAVLETVTDAKEDEVTVVQFEDDNAKTLARMASELLRYEARFGEDVATDASVDGADSSDEDITVEKYSDALKAERYSEDLDAEKVSEALGELLNKSLDGAEYDEEHRQEPGGRVRMEYDDSGRYSARINYIQSIHRKWAARSRNFNVGDIVMMVYKGNMVDDYRLGKVAKVYPCFSRFQRLTKDLSSINSPEN
jgi:hypothetical protein